MATREAVIQRANELAAEGREDDARALLKAWKAKQSSATPEKKKGPYKEPYQPSPDEPVRFDTQPFLDTMKQLRQGLSLGFWKDPEGEQRLKDAGMGGVATGANIAGNLATGGYGAARAAGSQAIRAIPSIWGRGAALAGVGAAEGGVTGAGYSNAEDSGELAQDVALGAGFGVAGAGAGAAMTHGGRLIRRLFGAGGEEAAKAKVAELARNLGFTENEVMAEIGKLGPGATLADIDDHFAILLRKALQNNPSEAARRGARRQFQERAEGSRGVLANEVESGIDARYTPDEVRAMTQSDQLDSASVMYQEAMDNAVVDLGQNPRLAQLVELPVMNDVIKQANQRLQLKNRPYGAFEVLHEAQRILGQRAGSNIDRSMKADYVQLKNALIGELDEISAKQGFSYADARAMYADAAQRKDALAAGEKLFRGGPKDPTEVEDAFIGYSQGEKEAYLAGAGQSARNKANWASIKDPGRVFNEQNMEVLRTIMGPEEFARFEQRVLAEARKMRTSKIVANASGLDEAGLSGAGALVYSASGNQTALAAVAMNKVAEVLQGMTPRAKDEAMKLLSKVGWTPEELKELLRFYNRGALDAGTKGVMISAGAQTGGALAED